MIAIRAKNRDRIIDRSVDKSLFMMADTADKTEIIKTLSSAENHSNICLIAYLQVSPDSFEWSDVKKMLMTSIRSRRRVKGDHRVKCVANFTSLIRIRKTNIFYEIISFNSRRKFA